MIEREAAAWRPIAERPEFDAQPIQQFVIIEGERDHSGLTWYRRAIGTAWISKSGPQGYSSKCFIRLCEEGDMDPRAALVTHWAPAIFPKLPEREVSDV